MSTKVKVSLVVVFALATFAFGRYSSPEKIRIETKTIEVEKIVYVEREKHKETTVVTRPDGSKEEHTVEDTKTSKKEDGKSKESSSLSESTSHGPKTNLSALAGVPFSDLRAPVYGLAATRSFIGPISAGVWALTSGTAGVSFGLSF